MSIQCSVRLCLLTWTATTTIPSSPSQSTCCIPTRLPCAGAYSTHPGIISEASINNLTDGVALIYPVDYASGHQRPSHLEATASVAAALFNHFLLTI